MTDEELPYAKQLASQKRWGWRDGMLCADPGHLSWRLAKALLEAWGAE